VGGGGTTNRAGELLPRLEDCAESCLYEEMFLKKRGLPIRRARKRATALERDFELEKKWGLYQRKGKLDADTIILRQGEEEKFDLERLLEPKTVGYSATEGCLARNDPPSGRHSGKRPPSKRRVFSEFAG